MVQAALGDKIIIPTPYGNTEHEIKPGTQPGTIVTLRNKGMPNVHSPNRIGDLEVLINVNVPTKLTARQQELLREFAEDGGGQAPASSAKDKKRFGKKR
jgi:molecular chaperone DnaJ